MFIPAANLQMISGRWKVAGDQNVKLGGWIETDHQGKATPSQGPQLYFWSVVDRPQSLSKKISKPSGWGT